MFFKKRKSFFERMLHPTWKLVVGQSRVVFLLPDRLEIRTNADVVDVQIFDRGGGPQHQHFLSLLNTLEGILDQKWRKDLLFLRWTLEALEFYRIFPRLSQAFGHRVEWTFQTFWVLQTETPKRQAGHYTFQSTARNTRFARSGSGVVAVTGKDGKTDWMAIYLDHLRRHTIPNRTTLVACAARAVSKAAPSLVFPLPPELQQEIAWHTSK